MILQSYLIAFELPVRIVDLDTITEPIASPSGLIIKFRNLETSPASSLSISLAVQPMNDSYQPIGSENYYSFSVPISSYGFSESASSEPFSYKFPVNGLIPTYSTFNISVSLVNSSGQPIEGSSYGATILTNGFFDVPNNWLDTAPDNAPECSIARLDVCFSNAMIFLFKPSPTILDNFKFETLSSRIPFSYLSEIKDLFSSSLSSPASSFALSVNIGQNVLPVLSSDIFASNPVSSLVRSFLSVLFYLLLPVVVYYRVIKYFG